MRGDQCSADDATCSPQTRTAELEFLDLDITHPCMYGYTVLWFVELCRKYMKTVVDYT